MIANQIIGILTDFISGVVWEWLATTQYNNLTYLVPSLLMKQSEKIIHLHHWLLYVGILLFVVILAAKTDRIYHPAVLMIIFALIGALTYNFIRFPNWYIFIEH